MLRLAPTAALTILFAQPTLLAAQDQLPEDPSPPAEQKKTSLNDKAEAAYVAGRFAETLKLTNERLKANDKDHIALYLRGSARIELGRVSRSREQVRTGISDARTAIELAGANNTKYYLPYLYGVSSLSEVENNADHARAAA